MKSFLGLVSTVVVLVAAVVLVVAGTADAGRPVPVRCVGTGDYCGAAIGIGGAKQSRVVTIDLTDTNVKLVSMTTVPASSRGSFLISESSYRLGGSQFRFRLSTLHANPPRARIILTFAAGGRAGKLGGAAPVLRGWEEATATFSVGAEKTVSIVGGGAGTSNCTRDETVTTFVTKGDNEPHNFGFYAKSEGVCFQVDSYSEFKVTVKDSAGNLVGSGAMLFKQNYIFGYFAYCGPSSVPWVGLTCEDKGTGQRGVKIHL